MGTGGGSGPGRFRAPVRFKPPGAKAGHLWARAVFGEDGQIKQKRGVLRLRNAKYLMHTWCFSQGETEVFSALRSKFLIFLAFVWAATAGKIGFKRQSLDKQKDPRLSNWETEVFSASRSKVPIFLAFVWAATAGKIGFKRQSLDKQKDPSLPN